MMANVTTIRRNADVATARVDSAEQRADETRRERHDGHRQPDFREQAGGDTADGEHRAH